ncbi:MAG: trigger factor [Bacteroidetes bacterium]|nr:MAG: trigger factor [Bacteroidota bacterium]
MATITRENVGLLTDKLSVTLQKDDYYPNFEKALKNYANKATIPGFRKGMVPLGVVKKMYGSSVFTDELLRTVEKEVTAWMEKERPAIFGQPLPLAENAATLAQVNMNAPTDFTFSFEMGLQPQVEPASLAAATITRHRVLATEAMVTEEVERMQTRLGSLREPETVDNEDNVLNLTFTEIDAEGNVVEGGVTKNNSLLVKYFADAVRPTLSGLKVGDATEIVLGEAFETKELDWLITDLGLAGNEAATQKRFRLSITKIGEVVKRELTEDFFEQVFPGRSIATEAEFRAAMLEDIQKQWDAQARSQVHNEIYKYLTEETAVELPEAFLKRWIQSSGEKQKTAEEVEAEFPTFIKSMRWNLITNVLEQRAQIQILPEELRAFAKAQMMNYMGVTQLDASNSWLEGYVDQMMKDKKFLDDNYNRLFTQKLFGWAESQVANFNDIEMTPDEFAARQEQAQ